MLLNVDLIRRRRDELGLSQRAVGRRLGVSSLTVARIEEGRNHEDLPLRQVARLADLLAVEPADLLDRPTTEPADDPDVAELGTLLASADEPAARSTLADALDTTAADVDRRLDRLDATLRPAGLRLHDGPDGVALVPDGAVRDDQQLQRLLRGQDAVHGLTSLDAQTLARALADTIDPARIGNAEQVSLARLRNAGLLTHDVQLTDDVVYSLGLDQAAS